MYCLNIHPGETLDEVVSTLQGAVAAVKRAVSPAAPYEIGLRLGNLAASEALAPARRNRLRQALDEGGFIVRHLNGFPFGRFHCAPVKTRVYTPDWTSPLRLEYTLKLAQILASLMPEGEKFGTISTVPFGYRATTRAAACFRLIDEAEARLGDLEAATGKHIELAFEPEPDCLAGSVKELLELLAPAPHRTVLIDTCHASVVGEDPGEAAARTLRAGFPLRRVQISAAITAAASQVEALARLANATYLHQTRLYAPSGELAAAFPDLTDEALDYLGRHRDLTAKVHCHVPLDWRGSDAFGSTADEIGDDFLVCCRDHEAALEIETYTYGVLPENIRPSSMEQGIAAEESWLQNRLLALPAE
ncbi:MAG: metabolite traffic protein EboE [Kiritimatiellia bacterium]